MLASKSISIAAVLVLTGCTAVGPDYVEPTGPIPHRFVGSGSDALVEAASVQWWQGLNDPLLNSLVERGLAQNLDISASYERIRAAAAALGRTGQEAQLSGLVSAQARRQQGEIGDVQSTSGLTLSAGYVFDLFGAGRHGTEQAVANFEAAQFDTGTVRLAYLADIVSSYIQARYFQEAASITRQTIQSRQQTLSLVNSRRESGEATELDLEQARSLLNTAEASLPFQMANFESNVFRIATLLAEPAGPILVKMRRGSRQPRPRYAGASGVPADLLRNRPDIRFAERNFAAATAALGVAEAQLYPSLALNGTVTQGSLDSWAFGPSLSLPLLNRGILEANRNIAISEARQAQIAWRNAVLIGIEDVQRGLSLASRWQSQVSSLEQASRASARVLDLSKQSYAGGAIILTEVLDAERANASNKLTAAGGVRDLALSWAQLQVAVGKGWYARGVDGPAKILKASKN